MRSPCVNRAKAIIWYIFDFSIMRRHTGLPLIYLLWVGSAVVTYKNLTKYLLRFPQRYFQVSSVGLARKGPVRDLKKRAPNNQMENVLIRISPDKKPRLARNPIFMYLHKTFFFNTIAIFYIYQFKTAI